MIRQAILLFLVVAPLLAGDPEPLTIGAKAPGFTLGNYDGKIHLLDSLISKNSCTVLMFISTRCPVSNAYNDRMVRLNQIYAKRGVGFIGINSNRQEGVAEIAEHAKDHGFAFPVLRDAGNKVADAYAAQVTPEIYVLGVDGILLYHGRIDDNRNPDKVTTKDLEAALDAILSNKTPHRTETKAFGCTIKRVSKD
jgi:peroxiredoxin